MPTRRKPGQVKQPAQLEEVTSPPERPLEEVTSPPVGLLEEASSPPAAPLKVLFIHPAYPSQFTAIGMELNKRGGFECYGMAHGLLGAAAANNADMPHFAFLPDGQPDQHSYVYSLATEQGMRTARGVLYSVAALSQFHRFDAIIGHAAFGTTLGLRSVTDSAIISYAELPGFQTSFARPDFPLSLDNSLPGLASESVIYSSLLASDLGIVPSNHALQLYPPELQTKMRVQMEGFAVLEAKPDRAVLGLPAEGKLVGFFGRTLEAVRGFDIFVQVAKRLRERDSNTHFVVIGEEESLYGNEKSFIGEQSFKNYALAQAGLPENFFIWRPMLPYELFRQHIACLDLVIMPLFEGAANWSLFEAMAVGLPILASDRAFVPEVLENNKEAILLNPYDVEGFVREGLKLLQDSAQAKTLGDAARQRLEQNFTVAKAAEGYGKIIREAVALHRAARK